MDKKIAVCLDTCMLILLSGAYHNYNGKTFPKSMQRQYEIAIKLIELYKEGVVQFFITPHVLKEYRDNAIVLNKGADIYATGFMADCVKLIKIKDKYLDEFSRTTANLIQGYKRECMKRNIPDFPLKDARVIAEASAVGLPIITQNGKDFVFSYTFMYKGEKHKMPRNQARRNYVKLVNEQNNIYGETLEGGRFVPIPFNFTEYVKSMGKKVDLLDEKYEYEMEPIKSRFVVDPSKYEICGFKSKAELSKK